MASDAGKPNTATRAFKLSVASAPPDVWLARKTPDPPKVDGKFKEGQWLFTQTAEKLVVGQSHPNRADFGATWDDERLYVGIRVCEKDPSAPRKTRLTPACSAR